MTCIFAHAIGGLWLGLRHLVGGRWISSCRLFDKASRNLEISIINSPSLSQLLHQSNHRQILLLLTSPQLIGKLQARSGRSDSRPPPRLILNSFCLNCYLDSDNGPTFDPRNLNKQGDSQDDITGPQRKLPPLSSSGTVIGQPSYAVTRALSPHEQPSSSEASPLPQLQPSAVPLTPKSLDDIDLPTSPHRAAVVGSAHSPPVSVSLAPHLQPSPNTKFACGHCPRTFTTRLKVMYGPSVFFSTPPFTC